MRNKLENSNYLVISIIFLIISMMFLSFASSSIYSVFCKATGAGGTVSISDTASMAKGTKQLVVRFDSNVEPGLKWYFYPKQGSVKIITGENNLVFYETINNSDKSTIGTAVYNVTPQKAGKYFNKIECFCFKEQLIKSGERILMPVSFFIDADFDKDPDMDDVKEITLSYSFFKIREVE